MKTRTKLRSVRDELEELSRTIRAERDRGKARPGDHAEECEHFRAGVFAGRCDATPLMASVVPCGDCPQTCPCFRRRP